MKSVGRFVRRFVFAQRCALNVPPASSGVIDAPAGVRRFCGGNHKSNWKGRRGGNRLESRWLLYLAGANTGGYGESRLAESVYLDACIWRKAENRGRYGHKAESAGDQKWIMLCSLPETLGERERDAAEICVHISEGRMACDSAQR